MNGGPGCTSLKGGFEELGQLVFNYHSLDDPSNPVPTLSYNPYGWTRVRSRRVTNRVRVRVRVRMHGALVVSAVAGVRKGQYDGVCLEQPHACTTLSYG